MSIVRRLVAPISAVGVAAAVLAPAAHAGVLVASATSCGAQSAVKAFWPWLDYADYVLAPQGTFEDGGDRWLLEGAVLAAENEPFHVNAPGDRSSLTIAPGGRATSSAMCVGIEHPTLRFFARRLDGSSLASLRVDVLFEDSMGGTRRATIGRVTGASSWQPTPPYPIAVNLLPLLPGDHTAVAFGFVADGSAAWAIDDVYVDPYQGR